MPGHTLTSRTQGSPLGSTIMSTRVTSRRPNARAARSAWATHDAATASSTRAGAKYSVAPAVYRAA